MPERRRGTGEESFRPRLTGRPEVEALLDLIEKEPKKLGRFKRYYFAGTFPERYGGEFITILDRPFGILRDLKTKMHVSDDEFLSWLERLNLRGTFVARGISGRNSRVQPSFCNSRQ